MTQAPTSVTPVLVSLSNMVLLRDSTLNDNPLIAQASRAYDEKYAIKLASQLENTPVTSWVPLEVIAMDDGGYVIIDGQHRYHAALLGDYPTDVNNLDSREKPTELPVYIREYTNELEIASRAYEANQRHGKPYDDKTRTAYAVLLYHHLEEVEGIAPHVRRVARLAGISHTSLNKGLAKEEKRLAKSNAGEASGATEKVTTKDAKKSVKKLIEASSTVYSSVVLVSPSMNETTNTLVTLLSETSDSDLAMLDKMIDALRKAIFRIKKQALTQIDIASIVEPATLVASPASDHLPVESDTTLVEPSTPPVKPAKKSKKHASKVPVQTTIDEQIAESEAPPVVDSFESQVNMRIG